MLYQKITEQDVYRLLMSTSLDFCNPIDGAVSLVDMARCLNTSRYQVKKHIKSLKDKDLVELGHYVIHDEEEIRPPYWGYRLTDKSKQTEEYIIARQERSQLLDEIFNS